MQRCRCPCNTTSTASATIRTSQRPRSWVWNPATSRCITQKPAKLEGGHVWGYCESSLYLSYHLSVDILFSSHWQGHGRTSVLQSTEKLCRQTLWPCKGTGEAWTENKTSHLQTWGCLPGLLGRKKRGFVFHHFCSVCSADLFLFHTRTKKSIDITAWPHRAKHSLLGKNGSRTK